MNKSKITQQLLFPLRVIVVFPVLLVTSVISKLVSYVVIPNLLNSTIVTAGLTPLKQSATLPTNHMTNESFHSVEEAELYLAQFAGKPDELLDAVTTPKFRQAVDCIVGALTEQERQELYAGARESQSRYQNRIEEQGYSTLEAILADDQEMIPHMNRLSPSALAQRQR